MADIQSVFKPRRGKKSTMNGTKKNIVLQNGEFFLEAPDTGVGTGHSKIKMGDGVRAYKDLPYAVGDTENNVITFAENTRSKVNEAINDVASGGKLKNLIAALKRACQLNASSISTLNTEYANFKKSFQDGCKTIADKITACGVTTASNASPSTMATNIQTIYNNRYTAGYNAGYAKGVSDADARVNKNSASYRQGVTDADARVNTNSESYKSGYNKGKSDGIAEADGRVNTSSASYTSGYNAGYTAGYNQGVSDADGRVNTSSASYTAGYNQGVTDADARVNTNSESYKKGKTDGFAEGEESGINKVKDNPGDYGISTGGFYGYDGTLASLKKMWIPKVYATNFLTDGAWAGIALFDLTGVSGYQDLKFGINVMGLLGIANTPNSGKYPDTIMITYPMAQGNVPDDMFPDNYHRYMTDGSRDEKFARMREFNKAIRNSNPATSGDEYWQVSSWGDENNMIQLDEIRAGGIGIRRCYLYMAYQVSKGRLYVISHHNNAVGDCLTLIKL